MVVVVVVKCGRVTHTRTNATGCPGSTERNTNERTNDNESAQGTAQMQRNPRNRKHLSMLAPSIRHAGRRETPPPTGGSRVRAGSIDPHGSAHQNAPGHLKP